MILQIECTSEKAFPLRELGPVDDRNVDLPEHWVVLIHTVNQNGLVVTRVWPRGVRDNLIQVDGVGLDLQNDGPCQLAIPAAGFCIYSMLVRALSYRDPDSRCAEDHWHQIEV